MIIASSTLLTKHWTNLKFPSCMITTRLFWSSKGFVLNGYRVSAISKSAIYRAVYVKEYAFKCDQSEAA